MTATHYKRGRKQRMRWSRNAVAKKARLRIERANSPQAEIAMPGLAKHRPQKFAVKINLERTDGARIQFTCHRIGERIYHKGNLVAPKSFFRCIGEIAELWSRD